MYMCNKHLESLHTNILTCEIDAFFSGKKFKGYKNTTSKAGTYIPLTLHTWETLSLETSAELRDSFIST